MYPTNPKRVSPTGLALLLMCLLALLAQTCVSEEVMRPRDNTRGVKINCDYDCGCDPYYDPDCNPIEHESCGDQDETVRTTSFLVTSPAQLPALVQVFCPSSLDFCKHDCGYSTTGGGGKGASCIRELGITVNGAPGIPRLLLFTASQCCGGVPQVQLQQESLLSGCSCGPKREGLELAIFRKFAAGTCLCVRIDLITNATAEPGIFPFVVDFRVVTNHCDRPCLTCLTGSTSTTVLSSPDQDQATSSLGAITYVHQGPLVEQEHAPPEDKAKESSAASRFW